MADPEPYHVADAKRAVGRQRHVAVLIVEGDNRKPGGRRLGPRHRARPVPVQGDGQAGIVTDIALTHAENDASGFRARLNVGPYLDAILELPGRQFQFGLTENAPMGRAVADAVVGQIATAADHLDDFAAVEASRREAFADAVVEGAATGAQDDRAVWRKELLSDDRFRHGQHIVKQAIDRGGVGENALEAFDASKREPRRPRDKSRNLERALGRPCAGTPAGDTDFDQHAEWSPRLAAACALGECGNTFGRIRKDVEVEPVIVAEGCETGVDRDPADRLIGDNHAPDTELPADRQLLHRRDRNRPSARLHLQRVELGRHGRLAMRGDLEVVGAREIRHPPVVGNQFVVEKNRGGQRQIAFQQIPTLRGHIIETKRARALRYAFHSRIEHHCRNALAITGR